MLIKVKTSGITSYPENEENLQKKLFLKVEYVEICHWINFQNVL